MMAKSDKERQAEKFVWKKGDVDITFSEEAKKALEEIEEEKKKKEKEKGKA